MDDENTYIDFMDYLDDESVAWMDENYDATPQTIMLESIRDIIRGDRNNVLCTRRKQRNIVVQLSRQKSKTFIMN